MRIEQILEHCDLTFLLGVLAVIGFFLAVYVNQLTHYEAEDSSDPWWIKVVFRPLSYITLALSFLWVLSYGQAHDWQPWPPMLMMILAIDMILFIRALAIKARVRRLGIKPEAPRAEYLRSKVIG